MLQVPLQAQYGEIAELLESRALAFPIATKAEFVEQMVRGGEYVVFRGNAYDTRFGANLIPDMFFPIASADDLLQKVAELFISRGLVPLPPAGGS